MVDNKAKIEFSGQVWKVQTLADQGIRLTLDLPESAIPQAAMLMECKRDGIPLRFMAFLDTQEAKALQSYGL